MSADHRAEWEKVTLRGKPILNVATWREYQAEFENTLARVTDTTDREAEKKIEQELPPELRKGLKLETLRRQESQFWVKFQDNFPFP